MRLTVLLALALAGAALASDNCLYDAIEWQGIEQVRACLDKGADPNGLTQYGTTGQYNALMLALVKNKLDVARLLKERGGKIDVDSDAGKYWVTNLGGSSVSRGGQPLWLYNLPAIEAALEMGLAIDARGTAGETMAFAAARSGNLELLRKLVEKGAKLDTANESGQTMLHAAAWRGDGPLIAYLIEKGASPMARDKSNRTPIQEAAGNGKQDAVELLIKHGATLSPDELGHLAAQPQSAGIAAKLIEAGASISKTELTRLARSGNWDMLDRALAGGAPGIDLARQAIWWAGDERTRQREGGKPADFARYEAVLARLLAGAKPDRALLGELLLLAIGKSDPAGVRVLIAAGADANFKTTYDTTALAEAARTGDPETIRELVKAKADLEGAGRDGRTPLFNAVIHNQLEAVRTLLDLGANLKKTDSMNLTASQLARQSGSPAILELLAARGGDAEGQQVARQRALVEATMREELPPFEEALKKVKDVNAPDDQKRVAIVQAAAYGRAAMVERLLAAGASPDSRDGDCDSPPPREEPAFRKPQLEELRPKAPAAPAAPPAHDRNVMEMDTDSPLPRAASRQALNVAHFNHVDTCRSALTAAIDADHAAVVKLLLAKKADVNRTLGWSRRTPLHAAARVGNPAVVRMLLEAGASPVAKDAKGQTALDVAREVGNTKAGRLIGAQR